MKRRAVLGLSCGSVLSLPGCLGMISSPKVVADEPTFSPGEEGIFSIEAKRVGGLTFEKIPERESVKIEFSDAELDPRPSHGVDTYPPVWYWRIPRLSVDVSIPVQVAPDATPGEYQYSVKTSSNNDITSNAITEEFSIIIADE